MIRTMPHQMDPTTYISNRNANKTEQFDNYGRCMTLTHRASYPHLPYADPAASGVPWKHDGGAAGLSKVQKAHPTRPGAV